MSVPGTEVGTRKRKMGHNMVPKRKRDKYPDSGYIWAPILGMKEMECAKSI